MIRTLPHYQTLIVNIFPCSLLLYKYSVDGQQALEWTFIRPTTMQIYFILFYYIIMYELSNFDHVLGVVSESRVSGGNRTKTLTDKTLYNTNCLFYFSALLIIQSLKFLLILLSFSKKIFFQANYISQYSHVSIFKKIYFVP